MAPYLHKFFKWFNLALWEGTVFLDISDLSRIYITLSFHTLSVGFQALGHSVQFSHSVVSDSLRPHDHSTPGLPVHQQLQEFTQTHIHPVGDAIQPSHPLSSLLLLPPFPPSIRVFSNESTLRMRWPKYWSFSSSIIPSKEGTGWISLQSKDSQESSPTPQFKSINSSALSLLYSPALTSIHDHRKNHSLD